LPISISTQSMFKIHPLSSNLQFPEPAFVFFSPRSAAMRLKNRKERIPQNFGKNPKLKSFAFKNEI
ncbi:MAG TPA: hypothetical protein VK927_08020, partial [Adhaeribacter sp.]|nr:hypothetical protein [Adhaeribacter sp.]